MPPNSDEPRRSFGCAEQGGPVASRRHALKSLLACTGVLLGPRAQASAFPSRPLTWVVPYAAGAATDVLTRQLAQALAGVLGQPLVVENQGGAGSTIGAARLARDKPDGYRIITLDVSALAIQPALASKIAYDPVKSFTPITMAWRIPFVLVTAASTGPRSLQELLHKARSGPGTLSYGSAGTGSAIHLAMVLLEAVADVQLTHVPYAGAAPALTDVLAGRVDAMFISLGAAQAHLKSGRLGALACSGAQRMPAAMEVPTIAELGHPGYEASSWQGVLGPPGLPDAVRDRLNATIRQVIADPLVAQKMRDSGAEPESSTASAFAEHIRSEVHKWAQLVRAKGIQTER